jgi:hypothetical protein
MPYQPFHELFPKVAEKETRSLTTFDNHPTLPADDYGLVEAYCNEPGCDCRRVFFNVISGRRQEIVAVVAYGWESKKFYARWFGRNDPDIINDLKGPALNFGSPQSELAPALLHEIKNVILQDKNYVDRLKRHYRMFKEVIDSEAFEPEEEQAVAPRPAIGRNDPCPCGSGKKYKHCCDRLKK